MKDNNFEARIKKHSENMMKSINAPFNISEKIDEMENCNMKKVVSFNWLKKTAYSAAGFAAAFVLMFNLIPGLSYAANDVPILGDLVRIVTLGRFEVKEGNYEADVVTPKIEGLLDKKLESKLNAEFSENADAVIAAFEKDVKELTEEFGKENFHLGVSADYVVKTDNENVLAIDFYVTEIMASGAESHRFYNIDKKTGMLITLESLFLKNSDYVTPISDYIIGEMKERNEREEGHYFIGEEDSEGFVKISEEQEFYINDAGNIVICFNEYEVAAGAEGCPEFEIPPYVIEKIRK